MASISDELIEQAIQAFKDPECALDVMVHMACEDSLTNAEQLAKTVRLGLALFLNYRALLDNSRDGSREMARGAKAFGEALETLKRVDRK